MKPKRRDPLVAPPHTRSEHDMPHTPWRHEYLAEMGRGVTFGKQSTHDTRPETELEALMQTAPHDTPVISSEEVERSPALDAFGALTEPDRTIARCIVFERMSMQKIADEYVWAPNKVWVHRRWKRIKEQLATQIGEE